MADSSDDDIPLSALLSKSAAKVKAGARVESSDDDDDVPLSMLLAQSKAKKTSTKPKKKKAVSKKRARASSSAAAGKAKKRKVTKSPAKKKATTRKKTTKKKASAKKSTSKKSSAEPASKSSIDDFKTGPKHSRKISTKSDVKLQLALAVLVRWWYVLDWPESTVETPGPDFQELTGMPGVFIGVGGDVIGNIIDMRDHASSSKPSLRNMMSKPCAELRDLWVGALQGQIQSLDESKESNFDTSAINNMELLLKAELLHAQGLDVAKLQKVADRQEKQKKKRKK